MSEYLGMPSDVWTYGVDEGSCADWRVSRNKDICETGAGAEQGPAGYKISKLVKEDKDSGDATASQSVSSSRAPRWKGTWNVGGTYLTRVR